MNPSADDVEIVKWQLKYINEHAGDLSPGDLEWAIKMEEAFKEFGSLTPRQQKVLSDIYKKC